MAATDGDRPARWAWSDAWEVRTLGATAVLGVVVGVTAVPSAALAVALLGVAQLLVSLAGGVARRRPLPWVAAIAVVSSAPTLVSDELADLAAVGGVPWTTIATAIGARHLYLHASDRVTIAIGSVLLVAGSLGAVVVSTRLGVPVPTALQAASVPFLGGVIVAGTTLLRDARRDRLRRPPTEVVAAAAGADAVDASTGALEAARRGLALVVLRSDELAASTDDEVARRTAEDLRDVAHRALTGGGRATRFVARVELHGAEAPEAAPGDRGREVPPMPDLPDREREVLRLVATGASNGSIARSLYLSEATVKQYVSRLMRRFERDNRTQLALLAVRWFDDEDVDGPPGGPGDGDARPGTGAPRG